MSRRTLFFPDLFKKQEVCLDLNGTDEWLRSPSNISLGIANSWSIMVCAKTESLASQQCLVNTTLSPTTRNNEIQIIHAGNAPGDPLIAFLRNSSGTVIKEYHFSGFGGTSVWRHFVVTWDGTNLKAYKDGTEVSPTKYTDIGGTMTNSSDRKLTLGASFNDGNDFYGRMHSAAMWDTCLDSSNISAIYNGGKPGEFDLTSDEGDYTDASNMVHWWRLGLDEDDIGKDYGNGGSPIDVMDYASNISSADIVEDSP